MLSAPAAVTVAASASSAIFSLSAGTVSSSQSAIVTASLNGSSATSTISLTAAAVLPTPSILGCSPSALTSNGSTTCTVTLSSAAPSGGAVVSLASNTSVSGGNSVYMYGGSPQFPTSTYQDSNYWADVVFSTAPVTPAATAVSLFNGAAVAPQIPWTSGNPVTLGVKFSSDVAGTVNGIRFYKGSSSNNGTHVGLLYTASGSLLAQATFAAESASGWQTVTFSSPVAIAANTTYIAAYFTPSGYAMSSQYFTSQAVNNVPLHAPQSNTTAGGNSVYMYGGSPQFPTNTYQDSNYWVDVLFSATPTPTTVTGVSLFNSAAIAPEVPWANGSPVTLGVKFSSDVAGTVSGIRYYKGSASNSGTHVGLLYTASGGLLAAANFSAESSSGWQTVTFSSPVAIAANTTYIAAYFTPSGYAMSSQYFTSQGVNNAPLHAPQSNTTAGGNSVYMYANSPQFPTNTYRDSNYWVDVVFSTAPATPPASGVSLFSAAAVSPAMPWAASSPVTLGVKFSSDVAGNVSGVRFYKGSSSNNGTHIGLLYTASGSVLAQATFTAETQSGWQTVTFPTPVAIAANTTYVAAYFTTSGYAITPQYFTSKAVNNAPLHAPQSGGGALAVPASVTVAAGATTGSFTITAGSVSSSQSVTLTATANGVSKTAAVTVQPLGSQSLAIPSETVVTSGLQTPTTLPGAVSFLNCSPRTARAGQQVKCELTLQRTGKAMGIRLTSNAEQLKVPGAVSARADQERLTFAALIDPAAKDQTVRISAAVGDRTVEDTLVVVGSANPVIRAPGKQFARFGTRLSFSVEGADVNQGALPVTAASLPAGAYFDGGSGKFEWTPTSDQAGQYKVAFTAVDAARRSSSTNVQIDVTAGIPELSGDVRCSAGAIGTLRGKWLASSGQAQSDATGGSLELSGTKVKVNGQYVPVLFASATRVRFVCPAGEAGTELTLAVEVGQAVSLPLNTTLLAASPEVIQLDAGGTQGAVTFAGSETVAAMRRFAVDGHPAQPGEQLVIWATGLGAGAERSVAVKVGGVEAEVQAVIAAPGYAGLYAVQVVMPAVDAGDEVPVNLEVATPAGRVAGNVVTIAVEAGSR